MAPSLPISVPLLAVVPSHLQPSNSAHLFVPKHTHIPQVNHSAITTSDSIASTATLLPSQLTEDLPSFGTAHNSSKHAHYPATHSAHAGTRTHEAFNIPTPASYVHSGAYKYSHHHLTINGTASTKTAHHTTRHAPSKASHHAVSKPHTIVKSAVQPTAPTADDAPKPSELKTLALAEGLKVLLDLLRDHPKWFPQIHKRAATLPKIHVAINATSASVQRLVEKFANTPTFLNITSDALDKFSEFARKELGHTDDYYRSEEEHHGHGHEKRGVDGEAIEGAAEHRKDEKYQHVVKGDKPNYYIC